MAEVTTHCDKTAIKEYNLKKKKKIRKKNYISAMKWKIWNIFTIGICNSHIPFNYFV